MNKERQPELQPGDTVSRAFYLNNLQEKRSEFADKMLKANLALMRLDQIEAEILRLERLGMKLRFFVNEDGALDYEYIERHEMGFRVKRGGNGIDKRSQPEDNSD